MDLEDADLMDISHTPTTPTRTIGTATSSLSTKQKKSPLTHTQNKWFKALPNGTDFQRKNHLETTPILMDEDTSDIPNRQFHQRNPATDEGEEAMTDKEAGGENQI